MTKILSYTESQSIDLISQKKYGISAEILMETAGEKLAEKIIFLLKTKIKNYKNILIFCGHSNNGGDGFVIARKLFDNNVKNISVIYLQEGKTELNQKNFSRLKNYKIKCKKFDRQIKVDKKDIIIDSLLGIGITGEPKDRYKEAIEFINNLKNLKISIDVPSGIYETRKNGVAIKSDWTLSIGTLKKPFYTPENRENCGKIINIENIFPLPALEEIKSECQLITEEFIKKNIFKIPPYSFKNRRGECAIFVGSKNYSGAAILSTKAVLKAGCGVATLWTDGETAKDVLKKNPQVIIKEEEDNPDLKKYGSVLIGCGWGLDEKKIELIKNIKNVTTPIIIDADGINLVAKYNLLKYIPENTIFTPHHKEYERLNPRKDGESFLEELKKFSVKNRVVVLYKSFFSVIATPSKQIFILDNPATAIGTAGSGDVLAGTIASFLSLGYSANVAPILATYIHNTAGVKLAEKGGWWTADKLIDEISKISYKFFTGESDE